jgi:ubiquinone/menaquinone biosynthesis C-methylase UbiE
LPLSGGEQGRYSVVLVGRVCDAGAVADRHFVDPRLAELYDLWAPPAERDDLGFYLPLVMAAEAVLDIGCGTGALLHLARQAGHRGRLCGLDPADGMLDLARRHTDIEWVSGEAASASWDQEFDLAVMTGHGFQVLVEDDEIRAALAAIRAALKNDGRLAFETRNPLARAWETWTTDNAVEAAAPPGEPVRMAHQVEQPFDGRTVSFITTYTSPGWNGPQLSHSTLRFLDAEQLAAFLSDTGFAIEDQLGDWDRRPLADTSPEIITVARRADTAMR